MGIKIRLQTCFALPGSESEIMALPQDVSTLRDLLNYMSGQMEFSFMDGTTGNVEEDLEIKINNKEVWFYPFALDTPLKEDDLVEIYLLPLGGG